MPQIQLISVSKRAPSESDHLSYGKMFVNKLVFCLYVKVLANVKAVVFWNQKILISEYWIMTCNNPHLIAYGAPSTYSFWPPIKCTFDENRAIYIKECADSFFLQGYNNVLYIWKLYNFLIFLCRNSLHYLLLGSDFSGLSNSPQT